MTTLARSGGSVTIETERLVYSHPSAGELAVTATSFSDVGESNGALPGISSRTAWTEHCNAYLNLLQTKCAGVQGGEYSLGVMSNVCR